MGHGPRYHIPFHRRAEGRTDYRRRLALLKSRTTRLVLRRSNRNLTVQFVDFAATGDLVRAEAEARELPDLGWDRATSNVPAAYLAGLLAGKRAKAAGVGKAVLDLGRAVPHAGGVLFAALAGVLEAGVEVPHGEDILPADGRIQGAHMQLPADRFAAVKAKIEEVV